LNQNVPYRVDDDVVDNIESLLELHIINRPTKLGLLKSHTKLLPSCIAPPKLELKPLYENLKYAYLGNDETLLVIISNVLTSKQERKHIRLLR